VGKERSGVVEGGLESEVKQKDQPNRCVAAHPLATTLISIGTTERKDSWTRESFEIRAFAVITKQIHCCTLEHF